MCLIQYVRSELVFCCFFCVQLSSNVVRMNLDAWRSWYPWLIFAISSFVCVHIQRGNIPRDCSKAVSRNACTCVKDWRVCNSLCFQFSLVVSSRVFLFKHLLDGKATVTIGSSNLRQSLDNFGCCSCILCAAEKSIDLLLPVVIDTSVAFVLLSFSFWSETCLLFYFTCTSWICECSELISGKWEKHAGQTYSSMMDWIWP